MKLADLIPELRILLDDEAEPYLWSDDSLRRYINEAEREACIRARLIPDETTSLTQLTVAANEGRVDLNPKITHVNRVYVAIDAKRCALKRTTVDNLDERVCGDWRNQTGQPCEYYDEINYLGIYPMPTTDVDLSLSVYRLPLEDVEADDDEPEIPERFHLQMLDWAAHIAFMRRDSDAQDQTRAASFDARFTATFGVRPDANVQRKRRLKKVPVCRPTW